MEANRRLSGAFFALGVEAWRRGELQLPTPSHPPTEQERALAAESLEGAPAELVSLCLSSWAHFHGLVTLEVLDQLDWIYPDAEAFFLAEVDAIADRLSPRL